MSVWQKLAGMKDRSNQEGGLFLKLVNDGDREVVAFVDEPLDREVYWTGARFVEANAETARQPFAEGKRPTTRIAINVFVPAQRCMKVLDGGIQLFSDILKCREKYGLEKTLFEIQRHGAAGDPKTTYSVLPEGPIGEQLAQEIARMRRIDLAAVLSGDSHEPQNDNSTPPQLAAVTQLVPSKPQLATEAIDNAVAMRFAERLKRLPRSAVDQFLREFQVQRIRDLRASQEAAAHALISRLERPEREPGDHEDYDPFDNQ